MESSILSYSFGTLIKPGINADIVIIGFPYD